MLTTPDSSEARGAGPAFRVVRDRTRSARALAVGERWETMVPLVPGGWHLRLDKPLRIPLRHSVPEPDLVMVRGSAQDYLEAHPAPADVALVVEIADSSLELDRGMVTVYGGGGVPVYWIVNLVDRQVEVYTDPCAAGYAKREVLKQGEVVSLIHEGALRGRIPVEDLLPRRRP